MTVYTIAQLKFVDIEAYRRYQRAFPAVFAKFNGTLLVADESPQVLEGEWQRDKVVVMPFPNTEEVERFHQSQEYLEIVKNRKAGAFVRCRRCPFPFLSVFRVAERPVWLPRHIAIVALYDPQGVS